MIFVTDGVGDTTIYVVVTLLLLASAIVMGIASLATRERPRWWAVVTLCIATITLVIAILWGIMMMAIFAGISQW